MRLYPAIDIKDGKCVRLVRGRMDQATIFNDDPAKQAQSFANAGADWLHIVDLNGAFEGCAVNEQAVRAIIASSDMKLQLGGGIRSMNQAEFWLNHGISRIILGTAMVKDPDFALACCKAFPGQIVLGLDSNQGKVALEGWAEQTQIEVDALALKYANSGAAAIIHTDIAMDGAMQGVNLKAMTSLAKAQPLPVIASGGVSRIKDIIELQQTGLIEGVVVGRALYEGTLDLQEALRYLANPGVAIKD